MLLEPGTKLLPAVAATDALCESTEAVESGGRSPGGGGLVREEKGRREVGERERGGREEEVAVSGRESKEAETRSARRWKSRNAKRSKVVQNIRHRKMAKAMDNPK